MRIQTHVRLSQILASALIPCLSISLTRSDASSLSAVIGGVLAEDSGKAAEVPISPQQLREQHQQLLHAIELVRRDADTNFQRYTAAVEKIRRDSETSVQRLAAAADARVERLKGTFAFERERDLQTLRRSNRFTLTVASVLVSVSLLGMFSMAWIMLRALNQLAFRVSLWSSGLASADSLPPGWDAAQVLFGSVAEGTNPRLQTAIERLERRLIELENCSSPPSPTMVPGPKSQTIQATSRPPAGKCVKTSGVSLTVGEGQALIFLPREERVPPFGALRNSLQKLWKRVALTRAARDNCQ